MPAYPPPGWILDAYYGANRWPQGPNYTPWNPMANGPYGPPAPASMQNALNPYIQSNLASTAGSHQNPFNPYIQSPFASTETPILSTSASQQQTQYHRPGSQYKPAPGGRGLTAGSRRAKMGGQGSGNRRPTGMQMLRSGYENWIQDNGGETGPTFEQWMQARMNTMRKLNLIGNANSPGFRQRLEQYDTVFQEELAQILGEGGTTPEEGQVGLQQSVPWGWASTLVNQRY